MGCCKCEEYSWDDPQEVVWRDGEGEEYCLFHAPLVCPAKTNIQLFNEMVYSRISDTIESGKACNLNGVIFPGDITFSRFNNDNPLPHIFFNNTRFYGDTDFSFTFFKGIAEFRDTRFYGLTDFRLVQFNQTIFFDNAIFDKCTNFNQTKCKDAIFITNTQFHCTVSFILSFFFKHLIISNTIFYDSTSFSHGNFEKLSIKYCVFVRKVNFSQSIFNNEVLCEYIDCLSTMDLSYTIFNTRSSFAFSCFVTLYLTGDLCTVAARIYLSIY